MTILTAVNKCRKKHPHLEFTRNGCCDVYYECQYWCCKECNHKFQFERFYIEDELHVTIRNQTGVFTGKYLVDNVPSCRELIIEDIIR